MIIIIITRTYIAHKAVASKCSLHSLSNLLKKMISKLLTFLSSAITCPEGTIYDPCSNPCPETCGTEPGYNCTYDECIENCRCPDDKILEGDRCVERSQCGCSLDNGLYLPVSSKNLFWCSVP